MSSQGSHVATIDSSIAYFTFTMGGASRVGIHAAANRLLKAEIAEMVGSPASPEVRVSPRYSNLVKLLREIDALRELASAVDSGGMRSWALRNPLRALRILPRIFSPSRRTSDAEPIDFPSFLSQMQENADFIASSVADEQAINAIQHAIEGEIYRSGYRAEEPYLRLRLRDIAVRLRMLSDGEVRAQDDFSEATYANATLLLHRSGVVQITIALRFPDRISAKKLAEIQFSGAQIISSAEYPEALLRATLNSRKLWSTLPGEWIDEVRAGTRWRRMSYAEPISVADLCLMYIDSITNIAIKDLPGEWICHPTVFVEEITCCPSEMEFRTQHRGELRELVTRYQSRHGQRGSSIDDLMPEDSSLNIDHSIYMSSSNSVSIRWPGFTGAEEYANHLQHVMIVECALLQYWQIRMIDWRVVQSRGQLKDIKTLQEDAIFGLREYRNSPLTHGTAMKITDRLLKEWHADRLYAHALESLNQLQQLVATGDSQSSARRANALAATAAVATVILGLPAVDETLSVARDIPNEGILGVIAAPLKELATRKAMGAWIGYLGLLSFVAAIVCLWNRRQKSLRVERWTKRRAGEPWPLGTIEITRREGDDA
ncbi:hypothetical protein ACIBBB_09970 [Streptomyces sp. NPDC051217]|uniref:hypothetical protein n=1 Tax=Streptomyces sp. NPDC051217 TaxID=3365644 RepID=UPI0037B2172A